MIGASGSVMALNFSNSRERKLLSGLRRRRRRRSRHRRGSDEIGEAGQAEPASPDVEAEMGIELTVGDRGRLDRVRRGAIPVDPAVGVVGEAEVEGAEAEFEP